VIDLPESWEFFTLGDVADWGSGGTPKATHSEYYQGNIPWAVIGDLNDGLVQDTEKHITEQAVANSSTKLIPVGAILIAMYGSIGKLGIAGVEMATNQAIAFAIPKESLILPKFLYWFLAAQRDQFLKNGKGMTQQNISQTLLKSWPIAVPRLEIQQRIVERLENYLGRLENASGDLDTATALTDSLKSSYLQKLFGQTNSDWTLNSVASVVDCEHKTAPRASAEVAGFSVGTSAVRGGVIDFSKAKPVSEQTLKTWTKRSTPIPGNLIYTREAPIGEVAIIPDTPSIALGQRTVLIQITQKELLPEYLHLWLQSPQIASWVRENSTGTTVLHLNVSDVKRLPIPVIPSVERQLQILKQFEKEMERLQRAIQEVRTSAFQIGALKRSLLNAAFTGQLIKEVQND
jgi:type I restriction enzyme S subunit